MSVNIEKIEFINLKNRTEYIDEVANLFWQEWSKEDGYTVEDVIYRTRHCLNDDDIPQTYIALYEGELVGMVSLWRNDLCARQDLYPWMAGLYVKEHYRKNGIGTFLQNNVIKITKKLGYDKLYLTTGHDNYYEKNNWKYLDKAPLGKGRIEKIYKYNIEL